MARVNVFLTDALLAAIDAEAAATRTSRSALIQSALTQLLEARRREREELATRQEMEQASRGMDALADKLGKWDPVGVIRDFRERRAFRVAERRGQYHPRKPKGRS